MASTPRPRKERTGIHKHGIGRLDAAPKRDFDPNAPDPEPSDFDSTGALKEGADPWQYGSDYQPGNTELPE
jgi:hypothetical protein